MRTGIEIKGYDSTSVSEFLEWTSQWKRNLVTSWIHNMSRSSSSACAAATGN